MSECQKENWHDQCCCNCKNQLVVHKHPWNRLEAAKGSISEVMGYACKPQDFPGVVFMESHHGMCEMWEAQPITEEPARVGCWEE